MNFESYILKANLFLKEIAIGIGEPQNKAKAGRVLRAVFHTLRMQFTAEESIHFIARLPILIKGIYVEGWHLTRFEVEVNHTRDFFTEVKEYNRNTGYNDFLNGHESIQMIRSVLEVLKRHIQEGEIDDIDSQPEEMADVILN